MHLLSIRDFINYEAVLGGMLDRSKEGFGTELKKVLKLLAESKQDLSTLLSFILVS